MLLQPSGSLHSLVELPSVPKPLGQWLSPPGMLIFFLFPYLNTHPSFKAHLEGSSINAHLLSLSLLSLSFLTLPSRLAPIFTHAVLFNCSSTHSSYSRTPLECFVHKNSFPQEVIYILQILHNNFMHMYFDFTANTKALRVSKYLSI